MKRFRSMILGLLAGLTLAVGAAQAATPNYSIAVPGVQMVPFQLDGQFTATITPIQFTLPFPATLIGFSGTCAASGGTSPTLTMDLEDDGTSVLSAAVSITAGTVAEGTVSTASLGDESDMTVVFTIGGTSPTWDDCTVLLTLIRR